MGLEPLNGFPDPLLEGMPRFKPKERLRPRNIQAAVPDQRVWCARFGSFGIST
jgi:hypothetical protein